MLISRALYPGVSNPSKIGRTSPDALSLSSEGIRRLSRARVPAGRGEERVRGSRPRLERCSWSRREWSPRVPPHLFHLRRTQRKGWL